MAPFPEEVDVFSGPHLTMKHLVDSYLEMLSGTDFSDVEATETLLRSLHSTFCVFRSHEQIENEYIMHRLRSRLKALAVADPHDSVVCNCHSDNRLTEMLELVGDGLDRRSTSSPAERLRYGRLLKTALAEFTRTFLPHMKEEEEVFQPLLIKYFEYDELVSLKEAVTVQHQRLGSAEEKFCSETREIDSKPDLDTIAISPEYFERLPPELTLKVFSYLWPPDLGRCAQVCSQWNDLIYHPSLWQSVVPANWARGIWQRPFDTYSPEDDPCYALSCSKCAAEEDYDIDESEENDVNDDEDEKDNNYKSNGIQVNGTSLNKSECGIQNKETVILNALRKYVLPRVGVNVRHLSFAGCASLNGKQLAVMLSQCPNVNHLDLSYTNINESDTLLLVAVFEKSKNVHRPRLAHLDLSGCSMLTDNGLERIIACLVHTSKLSYLSLSGCHRITDKGIRAFFPTASSRLSSLRYLNLSGCWNLSGAVLIAFVQRCSSLNPENLYYCDHITDGPHPQMANGCQNLECPFRRCCCA